MVFTVKTPLWSHQNKLVSFAQRRFNTDDKYVWWLSGCATGKTLAVLKLIEQMAFKRTLVLTTKPAIESAWLNGFTTHTEGGSIYCAGHNDSVKDKIIKLKNCSTDIYVVNYESAWRMLTALQGFDLVVADESHRLKSHNSKQSVVLSKIDAPYRLAMTGTAWDDRPTDVYGQVRFLAPDIKERRVDSEILGSWYKFFEKYVIYYTVDNIRIPKGYKNLDRLREILDPFTMYINTEDVLDLPDEMDIECRIPMPPTVRKLYRQMEDEFFAEHEADTLTADNVLVQALRLHQLTCGTFMDKTVDNSKLEYTLELLDETGNEPVVIFTRFVKDVENLHSRIPDAKMLTGERQEHIQWQNGEGRVLIANIQAGAEGIDLSRARYAIYYSIGHSRTKYNQSRYRIRRPNSTQPITYYHLLMENSIDLSIMQAMRSKERIDEILRKGLTNR